MILNNIPKITCDSQIDSTKEYADMIFSQGVLEIKVQTSTNPLFVVALIDSVHRAVQHIILSVLVSIRAPHITLISKLIQREHRVNQQSLNRLNGNVPFADFL